MVPKAGCRRGGGTSDMTIAALPAMGVLGRDVSGAVADSLLGVRRRMTWASLGGLVAAVNDPKSLERRESDCEVERSNQVVFRWFIHGLLFSVTEHMFVR